MKWTKDKAFILSHIPPTQILGSFKSIVSAKLSRQKKKLDLPCTTPLLQLLCTCQRLPAQYTLCSQMNQHSQSTQMYPMKNEVPLVTSILKMNHLSYWVERLATPTHLTRSSDVTIDFQPLNKHPIPPADLAKDPRDQPHLYSTPGDERSSVWEQRSGQPFRQHKT